MLSCMLLAIAFSSASDGYNIEAQQVYPIYLRNGGSPTGYDPSSVPAYAGYTFDATLTSNNISFVLGQPKDGIAGRNSSVGSIYFCNINFPDISNGFRGLSTSPVVTTEATAVNGLGSTSTAASLNTGTTATTRTRVSFSSDYSVPNCKQLTVFDSTNRDQVGDFHKFDNDALGLNLKRISNSSTYAVCAQGRLRECPGDKKTISSPGACYYGNPVTESWKFLKWNESKCFDNYIDVIFLVDGSGSIGRANFKTVKQWVINVTRLLMETYGDAVRTEVVQYANKDAAIFNIPVKDSRMFQIPYVLNDRLSIEEIKTKIENMIYLSSHTYTYYGLRRASEWEFLQSNRYSVSKKVIIVITDGAATDAAYLPRWWTKYGQTGIVTPFAVGVGNYERGELRTIANGGKNDERVSTVATFEDLGPLISTLIKDIATAVASEGQSATQDDQTAANSVNNRQLGASITSLEDGSLHFGAVGMYLDSGSMMRFQVDKDLSPDVSSYRTIETALPGLTTDSYMGYASVSGYFNGRSHGQYIAAGAPRHKMTGAVVIYKPLQNEAYVGSTFTILPPKGRDQVAAYFGGCLMSADVSGDGREDLFIASPLFVGENNDEGRVFVYISGGNDSVQDWTNGLFSPVELFGDKSAHSRFGTAIAAAGDINLDGYQDVVIGAPLVDNGRGGIFVYLGMDGSISPEPSQKILSSSLRGPSLHYFGQSLQGDIDIDNNGYPDILVGAPKSDSMVILRSRPISKISSTLTFMNSSFELFRCINEGYKNCATLRLCIIANGTSVEDTIGLVYTITLDSNVSTGSRVVFHETNFNKLSKDVTVQRESQRCVYHILDMLQNATDFKSVIEARATFESSPEFSRTPMSSVIEKNSTKRSQATLDWATGCVGRVCIPDLRLSVNVAIPKFSSPDPDLQSTLVITSQWDSVNMTGSFTNTGENSFNTKLKVLYPPGISLTLSTADQCLEVEGTSKTVNDSTEQIYKYNSQDNVLKPGTLCFFNLTAVTDSLGRNATLRDFKVKFSILPDSVTSVENTTTLEDNYFEKSVPIKYQSDISLRSDGGDAQITFNYTEGELFNITSIPEIGRNTSDFDIDFRIDGKGHSNIPSSVITFTYPWLLRDEHPLLYLFKLECLTTTGRAICTCDQTKVNAYNLSMDGIGQNDNAGSDTFPQSTTIANSGTPSSGQTGQITPTDFVLSGDDIVCPIRDPDSNYTCEVLTCTISNLYLSEVHFKASFRLWTDSIQSIYNNSKITSIGFRSKLKITTQNSLLYINKEGGNVTVIEDEVTLTASQYSEDEIIPSESLWMYIILGAAGGVMLIAFIIFVLWKGRFFENKYAKNLADEKELDEELNFSDEGKDCIDHPNNCDQEAATVAAT